MKGASANFARRRAISVLPTPVGPIIKMFLGVISWRKGSATREALPCEVGSGEKPRVAFKLAASKSWAKKHGIEFAVDPASLLDADVAAPADVKKVSAKSAKRTNH